MEHILYNSKAGFVSKTGSVVVSGADIQVDDISFTGIYFTLTIYGVGHIPIEGATVASTMRH